MGKCRDIENNRCRVCGSFVMDGATQRCYVRTDSENEGMRRYAMRVASRSKVLKFAPSPVQLGEYIEGFLTSVGVTKERYVAIKERIGLEPTCGCNKRREWLNKLGAELGFDDIMGRINKYRFGGNDGNSSQSDRVT